MKDLLSAAVAWIRDHTWVLWTGGASLLLFVAVLVAIPVIVVRMRPDYFIPGKRRHGPLCGRHPALAVAVTCLKNGLGILLVAVGLLMLVTPGQGILTIVVGLTLMNFPGKYRLEKWLITRRPVARGANWLRRRAGAAPLELP